MWSNTEAFPYRIDPVPLPFAVQESFVDLLLERQLITLDDAKTFKEERMARACGAHRTHCYHGEGVDLASQCERMVTIDPSP